MEEKEVEDKCWKWVYSPYITRNGRRIYHPKGKMYRFRVPC